MDALIVVSCAGCVATIILLVSLSWLLVVVEVQMIGLTVLVSPCDNCSASSSSLSNNILFQSLPLSAYVVDIGLVSVRDDVLRDVRKKVGCCVGGSVGFESSKERWSNCFLNDGLVMGYKA